MPLLNLDTHILVHALTGDLRPTEESMLIEHDWGVAAIVFWELIDEVSEQRYVFNAGL